MKNTFALAVLALAIPLSAAAQDKKAYTPPTKGKQVTQKVVPKRVIKKVEESQPITSEGVDVALSEEDLRMAKSVHTGEIKCELGANVKVEPDPKKEGYFLVTHDKTRFRMHPVNSRTGAVRLEDPKAEAMWLQLGNKSMLMSQKLGQRLADECQAAPQLEFAEQMKKNPPKSLFEGADPAK